MVDNNHYLGVGLGLRIPHYSFIFQHWPKVDVFEIISDNFMVAGGQPITNLHKILDKYKVIQHGVSLSLGSCDPLNKNYLSSLKSLCQLTKTPWVSDHLCWSSLNNTYFHDLLPLPYTQENANYIAEKIKIVQDYLDRPFAIENLSSYVNFKQSEMEEWEFLERIVSMSGCKILLDVNNIFVSSVNHQFNPHDYIDHLTKKNIIQIHVAGHTQKEDGTLLDTHDQFVRKEVWDLYGYLIKQMGKVTTILEWDDHLKDFETTWNHAKSAYKYLLNYENHSVAE